jgi:hypothetical protein
LIVVIEQAESEPTARLADADNFKQFHVAARGLELGELGAAVTSTSVGRLVDEHVWVERSWLESQGPAYPEWHDGLDSMLTYAAAKGWVSQDGRAVRAHVERG